MGARSLTDLAETVDPHAQRVGALLKARAAGMPYQGTKLDPAWLAGGQTAQGQFSPLASKPAAANSSAIPKSGNLQAAPRAVLGLAAQSSRINSDRARLGSLGKRSYKPNALTGPSGYTAPR